MPHYDFAAENGQTITLYLDLHQPKTAYCVQVVDGVVYKRIYSVPRAATNSRAGDLSEQDFIRVTQNKNLTMGEMQNISREMHEERKSKAGTDVVKERFYKDYEKRIGKPHTDVVRRERVAKAKAKMDKFGVKLEP